MQLRVVSDQPWDVKADVLVVPILGKPDFTGPLAELDKRTGGELSALQKFGELSTKRFKTSLANAGEAAAGRILIVGAGDAATLDRETVVKLAAAAERRLAGRSVTSIAIWISPLAAALDGGAELVAQLVARGVVEGHYEPQEIYRDGFKDGPPKLETLTLIATDTETAALVKAGEKGVIIGEGANIARTLANRSSNDVSPEVMAEEAWTLAEKHDLWIDVIGPEKATEMGMGLFMAVG
ncbi:MAG TPA: M17 family peptidase N-terminal domain-containing protein, partial [Candidatus Limnocylindrales bacterium]|nr:M17 family peptidase N-terminal domain-containing protein [Candidatus Limnocylindrales bacterium]